MDHPDDRSTSDALSLAELARLAEVTTRTVRYYIAQGLIPGPASSGPGNHYSGTHLGRIALIKRLQREHLPLAEIRSRVAALDDSAVALALSEAQSGDAEAQAVAAVEAATHPDRERALAYIRRVLDEGTSRRAGSLRRIMAPASDDRRAAAGPSPRLASRPSVPSPAAAQAEDPGTGASGSRLAKAHLAEAAPYGDVAAASPGGDLATESPAGDVAAASSAVHPTAPRSPRADASPAPDPAAPAARSRAFVAGPEAHADAGLAAAPPAGPAMLRPGARYEPQRPDAYPLPDEHVRPERSYPAMLPPSLPGRSMPSERSTWERVPLAADLELHIRRPLDRETNRRLDRLLAFARELFEGP